MFVRRKSTQRARRKRGRERGIALVMVLGALTILTVMLTESQDESSADFAAALSSRDALIAEYAARSAVNLTRLLIAAEPTIRTGVAPLLMMIAGGAAPPQLPVWEHADAALGAFNGGEGVANFAKLASVEASGGKNLGLSGANFEVVVADEDAKINVNAPARGEAFSEVRLAAQLYGLMSGPQYDALFSSRDLDGQFSDRSTICSAIIDWADPNQDQAVCDPNSVTAQQAAPEDSYYDLLPRPYMRKNAAFDSFEELRRVRGMSQDFWATFVDPDPDDPRRRVMTVWGQGAVNVNTANAQTIYALICAAATPGAPVCTDPAEAQKFLMAFSMVRDMIRNFAASAPLFGSPQVFVNALKGQGMFGTALAALGLQPITLKSETETLKQIATESKLFSIYATGRVKAGSRETVSRIHAVVDFRNAPPPGIDTRALDAAVALAGGGSAASGSGATSGNSSAAAGVEQAIMAVMKPSPGGNIVYYRVD